MSIATFSPEDLTALAEEGVLLNKQISFKDYLLHKGYQQLSARLFMKETPLELIRLTQKDGQTAYQNYAQKEDKGTLMDFLRNRSLEEGCVLPNKKIHTFLSAVNKAKKFLEDNSVRRKPVKSIRIIIDENSTRKGISR